MPFFSPKFRPASGELMNLDLMRLVACASIIFYHSYEFFFVDPARRAAAIASVRHLALFVDLFFVISGYVIAHSYDRKIVTIGSYGNFLRRRVGRLIPLHWLTLAVSIILTACLTLAHISPTHAPGFAPLCIADTAFLLHSYIDCGNHIYFNGQSWSISVEMGLYLLFPLIAYAGRKNDKILFCIAAFFIAAVALDGQRRQLDWVNIFTLLRGLPSFIFGAALFYARRVVGRLPQAPLWLAASTVLMIVMMFCDVPALAVLGLVYTVALSAVACDLQKKISPVFAKLAPYGCLTYSFYMWHGLFIFILINGLADKHMHGNIYALGLCTAACYAITLIVSCLSFSYFETPARGWIDGIKLSDKSARPDLDYNRRMV